MTRIAVLGLGEAGGALAADLATAGEVMAYDPAPTPTPEGVERRDDPAAAVAGAGLVLAVTTAAAAAAALDGVADALPAGSIYADLSTAGPRLKRQLATTAATAGARFVDVALMAPVPGRGLRTPALASGLGAEAFAAIVRPRGMPVEVVGPDPGQAAARKLLRSIVVKGLAQLVIEAMAAADASGVPTETWDELVAQLTAIDEDLVRRFLVGTPQHARRRIEELDATVELLGDLGVDATMSRATLARLRQIAADPAGVPPPPR